MKLPVYGIVGRGRVARHLALYFELESLPHRKWHRNLAESPEDALADTEIILLAISDDALDTWVKRHPALHGRTFVHCSGSRVVSGIHGVHPLMTFGPHRYDRATYQAIPFVSDRGGASFPDLFPSLPNPNWAIEPHQKPLYHALCVMAGNFPALLWNKVFESLETELGLPREVMTPYLQQTLANTLSNGRKALTGPLVREDRDTIERNLSALNGDPYADVYRAFASAHGLAGANP